MSNERDRARPTTEGALRGIQVVLLAFLALTVAWLLGELLLLLFAGVLLAVFLRSISSWLARRVPLGETVALLIVVVLLLGATAALVIVLAPQVAAQVDEMRRELPRAFESARRWVGQFEWGRALVDEGGTPDVTDVAGSRSAWQAAAGAFSGTLAALTNLVIIGFVGLYLAIEPRTYSKGLVCLVPLAHRERAAGVLEAIGETLQAWLLGKLLSMLVVGLATYAGLWALGLPLALTLSLIASALTFIPNIGPVVAAVPAILIGLLDGPRTAGLVAALYVAIQTVESYLITPLIQRRAVSLPPALTIAAQVLLGVTAGGFGLLVATPLTAAGMVAVRKLYVERK